MKQSMEIDLGGYNCVTVNRDSFWRDITVSQSMEIDLGGIELCHSQ